MTVKDCVAENKKRILITGAGGFIGSNLMRRMSLKYDVIGCGVMALDSPQCMVVNMMDLSKIQECIVSANPDIIIHCAGAANVGKSIIEPEWDYNANVTVTHNILFSLIKLNKKVKFIYLSSAAVYGNPKHLPITEQSELNPLSPYALHKIMCEDICRYVYSNYDIDMKICRIFSVYGVGQRKQIFWDMYNKIETTGKLELYGTGKESRDYIEIRDLINAIETIMLSDDNSIVYNVANGNEVFINYAAEVFVEQYNMPKDIIKFNNINKAGDPQNWRADISRLKALGYAPSIDFSMGIADYVKWVKALR